MALTPAEKQRRYRAKKRGQYVPALRPGPCRGYRQTAAHIDHKKRYGPQNHNWKGDAISLRSGRTRALRWYPETQPCANCGSEKTERHHRDCDPRNNNPENIIFFCRQCHARTHAEMRRLGQGISQIQFDVSEVR